MRRPYQPRATRTAAIVTAVDLGTEIGRARGAIDAGADPTKIPMIGERDHVARRDRVAVPHYEPRTRRTTGNWSHVRPSSSRPAFFLPRRTSAPPSSSSPNVPHCLKKNATSARTH